MTEDNLMDMTEEYLQSCLQYISEIPHLRINIHSSIQRIKDKKEVENNGKSNKGSSSSDQICSYCFSKVDLSRAEISLSKRGKKSERKLRIICHLCKKCVHESEIQFEPVTGDEDIEKDCDTIDKSNKEDCETPAAVSSNKKKKKSKRDQSAGLILPVSKTIATKSKPTLKQNPNKSKLKNLLDNQSGSSGKSNLMDFLKKI